jgi:hypothetical protein
LPDAATFEAILWQKAVREIGFPVPGTRVFFVRRRWRHFLKLVFEADLQGLEYVLGLLPGPKNILFFFLTITKTMILVIIMYVKM